MTDTAHFRRASPGLALGLLAGISIVGFVDRIIMNVLVEPIKAEFGLSDTQMGVVNGLAFASLNILMGLAIARIGERGRRLSLVALGSLLWSIATALCGLAGSYGQLLVARMGVGLGEAAGTPTISSILSDYFPPEKRVTAQGVNSLAPPIGAFIGAAGGSLVAQLWGWKAALLIAALPGLILTLLIHLLVAEPPRGQYDAMSAAEVDEVPPMRSVFVRYWQIPSLRHMLAGSAIASMIGFGLNTFLASYLSRRFGFSLVEAGLTSGIVASLPASLSVFGASWYADRLGKSNKRAYTLIPAITLLVATPVYIVGVTRETPFAAISLLGIAALCQYCYLGPTFGIFQNMMHPRMRVTSSAFISLVYALIGGGLGPFLMGMLSDFTATHAPNPGAALAWSLASFASLYLWAVIHYYLAARTIGEDLVRPMEAK